MKVLIVVDMQNDFLYGPLGSEEAQAIIPAVARKVQKYINNDDVIVYTRDTHYEDTYFETQEGKNLPVLHCVKGTDGWQIVSEIAICDNAIYVDKESFGSPFLASAIVNPRRLPSPSTQEEMGTIDEIELVGVCTDICVVSNALLLKSFYPEILVSVDASCCAGISSESHNAALKTMEMCQVKVKWHGDEYEDEVTPPIEDDDEIIIKKEN